MLQDLGIGCLEVSISSWMACAKDKVNIETMLCSSYSERSSEQAEFD